MRDLELNPHEILQELEQHLQVLPSYAGRELRVAPATKLVFKLAFHQASRAGRQTIESSDLFQAIFEESQGVPCRLFGATVWNPTSSARASPRGCATTNCARSVSGSGSSCRRS
jgi:ATP-dependent Clp protease ATP-binding subunit ClpA